MKKTLIALAALAATAGVAHAQSSVTLYGVADAFIGQNVTKVSTGGTETKLSQGKIDGSGLSSSRWGMRGSEDLGGGLAAVFTLESGFDISTGALANNGGSASSTASVLFGRVASVGLKGSFGEVRLGRQYTAYDSLRGATNNTYDSNTFAQTGTVWGTGIQDYSNRTNNSVRYDSPSFGGFSGAVVYGFGEDKTATASASNSTSVHLKYANGPLLVGYGYQREKETVGSTMFLGATGGAAVGTPAVVADSRKYNLLGASYDFGVVKLVGSYNTAKNNTLKDKEYQIGLSVPFGAASVAMGYERAKSEGAGSTNKGHGYSLLGTYDLSKRTTLYAGYINTKVESGTNASTTSKRTLLATGIRHTF
ncbi:MAG: porin [Polaromonas sp.]|uniref:porin n=1 Tax=Polaromonas sp. TaxID=1869339 RepID=UPI003263AD54